jgi:hypothetical protein
MAGVGLYLAVAFVISLLRPLTLFDLVIANDAQLAAHALIMLALFRRRLGGFGDTGVWTTLGKAALAASGMTICAGGAWALVAWLAPGDGLPQRILAVLVPGLAGVAVYFFAAMRLDISEFRQAVTIIRNKLGL